MDAWRCSYCGGPIRVNDAMVVLEATGYRRTTRAAEPEVRDAHGARAHWDCHANARAALFGTHDLAVAHPPYHH